MGEEAVFECWLDLEFSPRSAGVERIVIDVPGRAALAGDTPVEGLVGSAVRRDSVVSSARGLEIPLTPPLKQNVQLVIHFTTTQYSSAHAFRALVLADGSTMPLYAREDTVDGRSWTVVTSSVLKRVLLEAAALPPVVTPNGDGVNDSAVISFSVAKVDNVPVTVHILSLDGAVVRALYSGPLPAGTYDAGSPLQIGRWDGRDNRGGLVPPGIYLYRVTVHLDLHDERAVGTISVAY